VGGYDPYVYTDEEQRQLTVNLVRITTDIHEGRYSSSPIDTELLLRLHRELFDGIRDHAGRVRAPGYGPEHLTFGPNRSTHRNHVDKELSGAFERAQRPIAACEQDLDAPGYAKGAFYVAVWLHARVVEIHPFLDGNGRTSRLLMNIVLVRLGLRPVAVEIPKDEYNSALNRFFRGESLDTVVDLLLPCCVNAAHHRAT
jgi:fido (protein-threonine AMPylation protein)